MTFQNTAWTSIMKSSIIETCKSNVNALDCESWTALQHACINNHVDIVSYLLNNGAKTDIIAVYEQSRAEGFAQYRRFAETVAIFDTFFNSPDSKFLLVKSE
eukprot:216804_1